MSNSAIVPQKINTLEDVSNTLLDLQNDVSESVKEVISAQLHLLQVIQTPSLAGKACDTLILHLKLSLDRAHSEQEKENIRTNFALIIQELHMFLELQSQWEIDQWRNSGRDLLDATVKLVVNVSKRVISFAKSAICIGLDAAMGVAQIERGADPLPIMGNLAEDIKRTLMMQAPEQPTGFFSKVGRWLVSGSEIAKIEGNHLRVIADLTDKLVKYRKIIGPSIVVAGVVGHNISEMRSFLRSRNFCDSFGKLIPRLALETFQFTSGFYFLSLVVALFRLFGDKVDGWFGQQMLYTAIPAILISVVIVLVNNRIEIGAIKEINQLERKAKYFDVLS